MRRVELFIDEDNEGWGIDAISLVDVPAIEKNFMAFSKEKQNVTLARFDLDKRIVVGAALIPEKDIYRYNQETGEEYYIHFSKETVRKAANLYLKNQKHKATVMHESDTDKAYLYESWIKESDIDKSTHLGYVVPNGTWMVAMKIEDDELWNQVKDGKIQGFSIEGFFTELFDEKKNKQNQSNNINMSKANKVLAFLGFQSQIATKGTTKLNDGKEILLSTEELTEESVAFESEGVLLGDGSYTSESGQKFSIKDGAVSFEEKEELSTDFVSKAEFAEAIGKLVDIISDGQTQLSEDVDAKLDSIKAELSKTPLVTPAATTKPSTNNSFNLSDPASLMN